MAERRMFAKTIVFSDMFLDMPMSARCLYFTLGMFADDDGFVNQPKAIMRQCGASVDDMNILISKKFILTFEDGVIVIKHWKIHNYIQKDRYVPTKYEEHKQQLCLDENNSYKKKTECIQGVYKVDTQVSIETGKDNKERMNEDKEIRNYNARETYQSIMDDMCLESSVKPAMWEFIKHCQLNGKTLTNDKLTNILVEMDLQNLSPEEKSKVLLDAVNGGFFDIRRK